ncbi:MAG TPA: helix-turn-helix transcriptional regulator [Solirubrobacterales bacterium]
MKKKHREFAAYLTKRRKELGISMYTVAKQTGFSSSTVKWWEDGNGLPKLASLEPLAQALETSYENLVVMAGYAASGLPESEPYLRARYRHVSKRKLAEAKRIFDELDALEDRAKKGRRR